MGIRNFGQEHGGPPPPFLHAVADMEVQSRLGMGRAGGTAQEYAEI